MTPAFLLRAFGLVLACIGAPTALAADPPPLKLGSRFTVSGLSSGAAMAVQIGIAHSARVSGIGIVAGPPYLCAQGFVTKAINDCLRMGAEEARAAFGPYFGPLFSASEKDVDVRDLVEDTKRMARQRRIDPVEGIARQRVWEFRGDGDRTVGAKASAAQRAYFAEFGSGFERGQPPATGTEIPHTMPTDDTTQGGCNGDDQDYVSDCRFDAAGALLKHLTGSPSLPTDAGSGHWYTLDQGKFIPDQGRVTDPKQKRAMLGLAARARVYVPDRCLAAGGATDGAEVCSVHVALHGCRQGMTNAMYNTFVEHAGYVRRAAALKLVLLFPRVGAIAPFARGPWDSFANPRGCWDWWGYTTPTDLHGYATKDAPQIRTIINMVGHLGRTN
jgi:poly(3-hydroxybutyrate) depolymerase